MLNIAEEKIRRKLGSSRFIQDEKEIDFLYFTH